MDTDKNINEKLPEGWVLCNSKSTPGRKYYFNRKNGKSSWTQPQAEDKSDVQKGKKEKLANEKSMPVEPRKNLKRKSGGHEPDVSKKKPREDAHTSQKSKPASSSPVKQLTPVKHPTPTKLPTPTKYPTITKHPSQCKHPTPNKISPTKCKDVRKSQSPIKPSPKNLANTRLSQLRMRLSSEGQKSEDLTSPQPKSNKTSPNTPQTETKFGKDLKSPNGNEAKSTQSPSSESYQSLPSPSQFLAANKIISSMKAQLPDEYCKRIKPKDTFADIEQGICNQSAEYPKHPSTPPQFSEANKLVSAIKSKLSYKIPVKDSDVMQFASASDRMQKLRATLNNEENVDVSSDSNKDVISYSNEAMDVEECSESNSHVPSIQSTKETLDVASNSKENVVLVVDTNIFIHELDVIKNVINSHIKGYTEQPTLIVPWRVISELDRLKDNNNGNGAICKRARAAMDYLYKSLPENDKIKGQSLRDSNSHIYPCETPDDEILNCCLQQGERGKSVILISNDKNLCNKAVINKVKSITLGELSTLLEHKPQENVDPDLYPGVRHYTNCMYSLLANILENEMRAKYNNLWQRVLFKPPPWTLSDVLQCLLKHWIAVFNEVFPRIEHLLTDMKNSLKSIESKDPKSLSRSEVTNFKELCLEIAKKCQIIPEYMELAKMTVERLLRECASETDDERGKKPVIDAFEGLWTVFSSYCAKLSSNLGIAHNIEDKLPGLESSRDLTARWHSYSSQINALTYALKGALSVGLDSQSLEIHVNKIEHVFRESLILANLDSGGLNKESIRIFCVDCRNMLQEAYSKFSELTQLLQMCDSYISSD